MTIYAGRCHCGNIGYEYETALSPSAWSVRACACSFCSAHAARYTSDAAGSARFSISDPRRLKKYRFASRSIDFLLCSECGMLVGALRPGERRLCVVNVNTLRPVPEDLAPTQRLSFEAETPEAKQLRRETRWTPLVGGNLDEPVAAQ